MKSWWPFLLSIIASLAFHATAGEVTVEDNPDWGVNDEIIVSVTFKKHEIWRFARYYGWEVRIEDEDGEPIDNPVSERQFAKQVIREFVERPNLWTMFAKAEDRRGG